FVIAHAPVEPRGVEHEHRRGEPRVERDSEPREKNQVTEVHRVAAKAVRAARHQALGRNRDPGPPAAFARAVVADEAVLQVSPREQGQRPELNTRRALLQYRLGAKKHDRPENEGAVLQQGAPRIQLWALPLLAWG